MKLVPLKEPARRLNAKEQREVENVIDSVNLHLDDRVTHGKQLFRIWDDGLFLFYAKTWEEFLAKAFGKRLARSTAQDWISEAKGMTPVEGLAIQFTPQTATESADSRRAEQPDEGVVGVDIEVQQKAAIELSKVEDDAAKADIMTKAVQHYSKRNKDGEVVVTATAIKKAVEATSVAAPVIPPDDDEDEEEYEELAVADLAKEMASEIESLCRTVLKSINDGLNALSGPSRTFTMSKGMDDAAVEAVKKALATLRRTKPVVCPPCQGEGCIHCDQEGIVTTDKASSLKGVQL